MVLILVITTIMPDPITPGNSQAQAIDRLLDAIVTDSDFKDLKFLNTNHPKNYQKTLTNLGKFLAIQAMKQLDKKITIVGKNYDA